MANVKVSALPAAGALDGTEYVPIVQSGGSKKATALQLKTYIADGLTPPSGGTDLHPELGSVYTKNSNFSLVDFTVLGSAAALSAGDILLSGGTSKTDFTKGVVLNLFEDCDNKVTAQARFTLNSTVGAISISKVSIQTGFYMPSLHGQFDLSDGKVKAYQSGNSPGANAYHATSIDGVQVINGALYDFMFRIDEWLLIMVVSRLDSTTGEVIETAWSVSEFDYRTQSYINSNTSKFCLFTHGGSQRLSGLDISSQSLVGCPAVCADSKGVPVGSFSYSDAWHSILGAGMGLHFNCMAGNGDKIRQQVRCLPRLIALKTPVALFVVGRNNLADGGLTQEVEDEVTDFDAAATAEGITVLYLWNIPENDITDQSAVGNMYNRLFPGRVFDLSTGFDKSTMLNSENENPAIHENSLGGVHIGLMLLQNKGFRIAFNRGMDNAKKFRKMAALAAA